MNRLTAFPAHIVPKPKGNHHHRESDECPQNGHPENRPTEICFHLANRLPRIAETIDYIQTDADREYPDAHSHKAHKARIHLACFSAVSHSSTIPTKSSNENR